MPRSFHYIPLAIAIVSSAAILSLRLSAQTMGSPERYSATAMDINNGRAGNIDIAVNRWSSDKQRDALTAVAMQKGPEKLLDALQDMPVVGHFGAPGSLSWDIHFARKTPSPDGGERVVLITDRRIGFWEATNQPRSIDYPFTFIDIRLNRDGEGEGKMSLATKVIYDKKDNMVSLENFETSPVLLTNVKREVVTHGRSRRHMRHGGLGHVETLESAGRNRKQLWSRSTGGSTGGRRIDGAAAAAQSTASKAKGVAPGSAADQLGGSTSPRHGDRLSRRLCDPICSAGQRSSPKTWERVGLSLPCRLYRRQAWN